MKLLTKIAALGSRPVILLKHYPGVLCDLGIVAILLFLMIIGGWIALVMNARADEKAVKRELVADQGFYYVDRHAADSPGGVYFRT